MKTQRTGLKKLRPRPVLGGVITIAFVFFAPVAFAQVAFNEIQISPIGERFIELFNSSGSDVDLTGWYIQRQTDGGSSFGSLVTSTQLNSKTIKANGYFLISRSQLGNSDVVVDNLTLTENNIVRIRNSKGEDIDQRAWTTMSDGESFQKIGSTWQIGSPTPGQANSSQSATVTTSSAQAVSSNTTVATSITNDTSVQFDTSMYTRITVQSGSTVSGAPILFLGEAVDSKKKPIENAIYVWAFGDGETGSGKTASHIFRYAGNYVVTLEVTSGQGSTPVITHLKVNVSPALLRASLYATSSAAINILNEGTKDIDLSSWMISADYHRFVIPEHTMLLAGSTVTFSPETTKFHSPVSFIQIFYPNGLPYEQPEKESPFETQEATKIVPVAPPTTNLVFARKYPDEAIQHSITSPTVQKNPISLNQSASVIDAVSSPEISSAPTQNRDGLWLWYTSAAFLGALALFGVRFIQSKEQKTTFTADDFKIIEVVDGGEPH